VETRPGGLERWWLSVAKRTAENLQAKLQLEIYASPGAGFDVPGVSQSSGSFITEIQQFRAEVFFAAGRRPWFRKEDGSFADTATADDHAYHIVCRDEHGALAGYLRADLADLQRRSSVAEHLGMARAAGVLHRLGVPSSQVLEMGRLAVATDSRWQGIAEALIVSAHVLACRLGCLVLWCVAAEGDGQNHYFLRYGGTALPESSAYVPRYSDRACVVIQDLRVILPRVRTAVHMIDQAVFGAANGASSQGGGGEDEHHPGHI
jgi:predicted N-acetyltransferase YhbS